jgi:hypothetical protein
MSMSVSVDFPFLIVPSLTFTRKKDVGQAKQSTKTKCKTTQEANKISNTDPTRVNSVSPEG